MNEDTQSPHQPNTARNILLRAYSGVLAWSGVHTVATAAILGFLAGWLLPKIARLIWG